MSSPADGTRPKSIHAYRDAVLSSNGPGSPTERLVAVTVAQRMDKRTLESFAGAEAIAKHSGLSLRSVKSNLAKLSRAGWLQERPKLSGRNYWLKVRRASLPAGYPTQTPGDGAADARSHPHDSVHDVHRVRDAGLGADSARLGASDDRSGCKTLHGEGAPGAPDLGKRSRTYLEQDPVTRARARGSAASPSPGDPGSAAPEPDSEQTELVRDLHRKGYSAAQIAKFEKQHHLTFDQVAAIVTHLERAKLQAGR